MDFFDRFSSDSNVGAILLLLLITEDHMRDVIRIPIGYVLSFSPRLLTLLEEIYWLALASDDDIEYRLVAFAKLKLRLVLNEDL